MRGFFAGGHVADLILAVMALEAVWLLWRKRSPVEVLLILGPGACLVLALRAALVGCEWPWIALPLTAAFPLHLLDLARRRPPP